MNCTVNLFEDLVPDNEQHPNYKNTKNDQYLIYELNKWADKLFVERDGKKKFIKEFQTEFNSCFWEL